MQTQFVSHQKIKIPHRYTNKTQKEIEMIQNWTYFVQWPMFMHEIWWMSEGNFDFVFLECFLQGLLNTVLNVELWSQVLIYKPWNM